MSGSGLKPWCRHDHPVRRAEWPGGPCTPYPAAHERRQNPEDGCSFPSLRRSSSRCSVGTTRRSGPRQSRSRWSPPQRLPWHSFHADGPAWRSPPAWRSSGYGWASCITPCSSHPSIRPPWASPPCRWRLPARSPGTASPAGGSLSGTRSIRSLVGLALVLFSLTVYPAWATLAGHRYPAMPTFGLPCPTTRFTIGMLCLLVPPYPRWPLVVPILWCIVGSQAAFLLGVPQDLALLPAAAVGVLLAMRQNAPRAMPKPGA